MDKVSVPLKAFVIGSGVILVVGTIVLAVLIGLRMTAGGNERARVDAGPAIAEIALPAGARVEQVVPDQERLLLLGVGRDGRQFLAVVDPSAGVLRQLFHLVPEATP